MRKYRDGNRVIIYPFVVRVYGIWYPFFKTSIYYVRVSLFLMVSSPSCRSGVLSMNQRPPSRSLRQDPWALLASFVGLLGASYAVRGCEVWGSGGKPRRRSSIFPPSTEENLSDKSRCKDYGHQARLLDFEMIPDDALLAFLAHPPCSRCRRASPIATRPFASSIAPLGRSRWCQGVI